jgi:hypothetical protein
MSYTQINISDIQNLVQNKTFEQVKHVAENSGLRVRELNNGNEDLKNLYLLVDAEEETTSPLGIQSNGIILEKETNKVVCMSQNKFVMINSNEQIDNLKDTYSKFRMEYCEDGTVIRLYNYKGTWYTATTKCIDANHSYWSSKKTFDSMFWEIFDKDTNNLDVSYTYVFVLIHKDNRIVINHKYNNLIYINRIHNDSKLEDYTNHFYSDDKNRSIRRTKQIESNNGEIHYPLDDYYNPSKRGVIIKFYNKELNNWIIYQYDFNSYSQIKQVRGNVPLIRMRYLELLQDQDTLQRLEDYYKESFFLFTMIKHQMNNLYKEIHKLYFDSHIKHTVTVTEDHPFYRTMKQLHGIYKNTGNPITLEEVKKKVDTLDPNVLRKFLHWVN